MGREIIYCPGGFYIGCKKKTGTTFTSTKRDWRQTFVRGRIFSGLINAVGTSACTGVLPNPLSMPEDGFFRGMVDATAGACPSNGRDCDGSEMSRMRGGGSSRLLIMSLRDPTTKQAGHFRPTRGAALRSTIRARYAIVAVSCRAPDG